MRAFPTFVLPAILSVAAFAAPAQDRPPVIQHQPVTIAVRGQPLIVRARVSDDRGALKTVKLFYSASRDAAPFGLNMEPSGGGLFVGAIPPHLLAGVEQIAYYIEATDAQDNATETPWHTVRIRAPEPGDTPPDAGKRPKWVMPALVAGGAAIVVGGALYAAGGGGGGGEAFPPDAPGIYSGTVTRVTQDPGLPPQVDSYAATLIIAADGSLSSDSLQPGILLTGRLNGSRFTLTGAISEAGATGQIAFRGTVESGRIDGSIDGTRETAAGAGTYSGSFTLQKP